jgi:hypothetical protein
MDKKWSIIAMICLVIFVVQHLYYLKDVKIECSKRGGVLVRGATTMYECVEKK